MVTITDTHSEITRLETFHPHIWKKMLSLRHESESEEDNKILVHQENSYKIPSDFARQSSILKRHRTWHTASLFFKYMWHVQTCKQSASYCDQRERGRLEDKYFSNDYLFSPSLILDWNGIYGSIKIVSERQERIISQKNISYWVVVK